MLRAGRYLGWSALGLLLWCGNKPGTTAAQLPRSGSLLAEIDARPQQEGRGSLELGVRLEIRGLAPRKGLYLKRAAPERELTIRDLKVSAGGQPVSASLEGERYVLGGLSEDKPVDLDVQYTISVGGLGRHGHQGYIGADWATFDGRVILAPSGAQDLEKLEVKYVLPEGWVAATPFRQDGDRYVVDGYGHAAWEALSTSCVGLGRLDVSEEMLGQTPIRIALYGGWPEEERQRLKSGIQRMSTYFRDTLGFDPGRPFQIVFTPPGPEERPVFGGAWSNGACYERPRDGMRNWQLLGHRFAHPLNKDLPDGISMRDARDAWFTEGWASYIEIVSTMAVGLDPDKQGFNKLYQGYLQGIERHPEYLVPLADEPKSKDKLKEFQHYTTGPLVVAMLSQTLEERSGKGLEPFMREIFASHKGFSPQVALRDELERFSGVDLDDFFAMYVDQPAPIVPVWEEWLSRPDAEGSGPVVGSVGRMNVTESYLFYLLRDGGFGSIAEIEAFLSEVARREALLQGKGDRLPWPDALSDRTSKIGSGARFQMDKALLAIPGWALPQERSSGCSGGEESHEGEPLLLDHSTEAGRLLHEMQRTEERYQDARGLLVRSIDLKWGERDDRGDATFPYSLAVRRSDPMFVMVGWNDAVSSAKLEVLDGEKVLQTKEISVEPGWRVSWSTLSQKSLGEASGLLTLRVRAGDVVLAERAFWRK